MGLSERIHTAVLTLNVHVVRWFQIKTKAIASATEGAFVIVLSVRVLESRERLN